MSTDTAFTIIAMLTLAINITSIFLIFPAKYRLSVSVAVCVFFTVAASFALRFIPLSVGFEAGILGIVYLPLMIILLRGMFFQKVFAFFLTYQMTLLQRVFAQKIAEAFFAESSPEYSAALLIIVLIMFSAYVFWLFKFARSVFAKLFEQGRTAEWSLYSLGGILSYAVLTIYRVMPNGAWSDFMLLLFILWSFCILCFAIISTNEKARQRFDAERRERELADEADRRERELADEKALLTARIGALLRRARMVGKNPSIGSLRFDLLKSRVFVGETDLHLTQKEFALLYLLAQNERKTLTAQHLYEKVWGQPLNDNTSALRFQMSNLSKKITAATRDIIIESFYNEGYCLTIFR